AAWRRADVRPAVDAVAVISSATSTIAARGHANRRGGRPGCDRQSCFGCWRWADSSAARRQRSADSTVAASGTTAPANCYAEASESTALANSTEAPARPRRDSTDSPKDGWERSAAGCEPAAALAACSAARSALDDCSAPPDYSDGN